MTLMGTILSFRDIAENLIVHSVRSTEDARAIDVEQRAAVNETLPNGFSVFESLQFRHMVVEPLKKPKTSKRKHGESRHQRIHKNMRPRLEMDDLTYGASSEGALDD